MCFCSCFGCLGFGVDRELQDLDHAVFLGLLVNKTKDYEPNPVKTSQFKTIQINSNQIKSNQIKSIQFNQFTEGKERKRTERK